MMMIVTKNKKNLVLAARGGRALLQLGRRTRTAALLLTAAAAVALPVEADTASSRSCAAFLGIGDGFQAGPATVFQHNARRRTRTARLFSSSSSSFDQDALVSMQKRASDRLKEQRRQQNEEKTEEKEEDETKFLRHQKATFDEVSGFFASEKAVTADLVPSYESIAHGVVGSLLLLNAVTAEAASVDEASATTTTTTPTTTTRLKILDAACGTGPFFRYLVEEADRRNNNSNEEQQEEEGNGRGVPTIQLDLTGVDLSPEMVRLARENASRILEQQQRQKHTIRVVEADATRWYEEGEGGEGVEGSFDGVLANACFGNFYDQPKFLRHASDRLLKTNGKLFVTHPLGSSFVNDNLHAKEPDTVPHRLPASPREWYRLLVAGTGGDGASVGGGVPLQLEEFVDDNEGVEGAGGSYYFASLRRVRHVLLPRIVRLRGPVASGYGRGGKKLGFPTANLPESDFSGALEDRVSAGVYFGYAVLEQGTTTTPSSGSGGRGVPHMAVVNVGYSPTFEGKENREKIVEAHLILEEQGQLEPPDFYGETMRLQLVAFLRPEQKFDSFPDLVRQIGTDKEDSRRALTESMQYRQFLADPFLLDNNSRGVWVGGSNNNGEGGGNEVSSWEFQDMQDVLENL